MEKFHYFLYGNKFTLERDQKQLVAIYQKHLVDVSPRIQRLIMRTLPYDFHVVYVPGKLIPMADSPSRNLKFTSKDEEEDQISLPILAVNYITGNYEQPQTTCNGPDLGGNFQRCHITIADKVHQK